MNLAPLVVAARVGAAQAARTASRERARARRKPAWWQARWVMVTTAGLAVLGAAGGVYAVFAQRSRSGQPTMTGTGGAIGNQDGHGSMVDTGREKVTGLARNVVHKFRRSEQPPVSPDAARTPQPAGMPGDHAPDGGYHGPVT
ncbi:MAG TPA: hypothetical protein VIL37_12800 [Natronosporangium sp.]